jgi:predicted RNA-binding Zn-ribbon protein involved in translation (DUF1610 family)
MAVKSGDTDRARQWESVHVCPQCGFRIALAKLGLRSSTTGLVTCLKCDWSGPIEIRVLNVDLTH